MTKLSLPLVAVALLVLVLVSGCIDPVTGAIDTAKMDPVMADFLAKNVRANITVNEWNEADSKNRIDYLVERCGPSINPTDYYYILVEQGENVAEAWIHRQVPSVACVHTSYDQCVSTYDCEDGDLCTIDACTGIPKDCSRQRIRQCSGGDGCCPEGCTFNVDSDCQIDECLVHTDCDDKEPGTRDYCEGIPKKCVYEAVTDCVEGDDFCPEGCNYSIDADCVIGECERDADCDDDDDSTTDYCDGRPTLCWHQKKTLCIDNDDFCPKHCTYKTDNDCEAQTSNQERITVECRDYKTHLDSPLLLYGKELKARFEEQVTHASNDGLIFHQFKNYIYNNRGRGLEGVDLSNTTSIVERIVINGMASFNRADNKSYFRFNTGGFHYDIELLSGVPVTELETNDKPFVAGNDDKIPIVLFGKDSLLTAADMTPGNEMIEVLADYTELYVPQGGIVKNVVGKNRRNHTIRVVACHERDAVFSLYDGDDLIKSQTASSSDFLFEDLLEKTIRLNYLHRDTTTGRCDFRYATGTIETIYSGQEYPVGSGSGWIAQLSFDDKKLKKISFEKDDVGSADPIKAGEELLILPSDGTSGLGFCSLKFFGVVR
jgi:hypothetical protein